MCYMMAPFRRLVNDSQALGLHRQDWMCCMMAIRQHALPVIHRSVLQTPMAPPLVPLWGRSPG